MSTKHSPTRASAPKSFYCTEAAAAMSAAFRASARCSTRGVKKTKQNNNNNNNNNRWADISSSLHQCNCLPSVSMMFLCLLVFLFCFVFVCVQLVRKSSRGEVRYLEKDKSGSQYHQANCAAKKVGMQLGTWRPVLRSRRHTVDSSQL